MKVLPHLCAAIALLTACTPSPYQRDPSPNEILVFEAASYALNRPLQRPTHMPMSHESIGFFTPITPGPSWLTHHPRHDTGCMEPLQPEDLEDVPVAQKHSYKAAEALVWEWASCSVQGDGTVLSENFRCPPNPDKFLGLLDIKTEDIITADSYGEPIKEPAMRPDLVPYKVMYNALFMLCLKDAAQKAFESLSEPWPENMSGDILHETWVELCSGGQRTTSYKEWRTHLFGVGGAASASASSTDGILIDVLLSSGHSWADSMDAVMSQYPEHDISCRSRL